MVFFRNDTNHNQIKFWSEVQCHLLHRNPLDDELFSKDLLKSLLLCFNTPYLQLAVAACDNFEVDVLLVHPGESDMLDKRSMAPVKALAQADNVVRIRSASRSRDSRSTTSRSFFLGAFFRWKRAMLAMNVISFWSNPSSSEFFII